MCNSNNHPKGAWQHRPFVLYDNAKEFAKDRMNVTHIPHMVITSTGEHPVYYVVPESLVLYNSGEAEYVSL